jgi:hypothetical protein
MGSEILSIVVDEAKGVFSGQAVASSTSSPSLNLFPATTSVNRTGIIGDRNL